MSRGTPLIKRLLLILAFFPSLAWAVANYQATSGLIGDADPHADTTMSLPTHLTDDVIYCKAWVRDVDDTATITVATGWVAVTGYPNDQGTATRTWMWWKRAASASETSPVIDYSGTTADSYYECVSFRGAITTETPHEVLGTPTDGTADPATFTTISSLTANSLIVLALEGEDNNNGPTPGCTTTGTDPSAYTEHYEEIATGADAMSCWSEAVRTAAGATGTVSVDFDTAVPVGWDGVLMAIKPVPPPEGQVIFIASLEVKK
jgi:hypothetical protein